MAALADDAGKTTAPAQSATAQAKTTPGQGDENHRKDVESDDAKRAAVEQQRERAKASSPRRRKISRADFLFGATLGEGAYAIVIHAKRKKSGHQFAMKVMEKDFIRQQKKQAFVVLERRILSSLDHPNIAKLYYTFQDEQKLYFALDLCPNGELLGLIRSYAEKEMESGRPNKALPPTTAAFYAAEIVRAIEYIHGKGIIHRDIKVSFAALHTSHILGSGNGKDNNY